MKVLVVVDMQNDFIDGALGTKEAEAIVDKVADKIKNFDGMIFFTQDTHNGNYLKTQEGRKLPVEHCMYGTHGWEIHPKIKKYVNNDMHIIDKDTFGSFELPKRILHDLVYHMQVEEIELVGLCTDICVISNAMILKSYFSEAEIIVDSACCAGVTIESHNNALEAMKMCQIEVR